MLIQNGLQCWAIGLISSQAKRISLLEILQMQGREVVSQKIVEFFMSSTKKALEFEAVVFEIETALDFAN